MITRASATGIIVNCLKSEIQVTSGCTCILDYWVCLFFFAKMCNVYISSWSYGWKLEFFATFGVPWPLTYNIYQQKWLLISMFPTKYHDHWILQAEIMAENSHIWPQINDLWPCNLTFDPYYLLEMYGYLFQSFLPYFMTIGHSKLKL